MPINRTQTVTRKGSFDAAHRVMHNAFKCKNIHGHLYQYELTFEFDNVEDIGYAVDFSELKRIGCQFFDDHFDHGVILNPKDEILSEAAMKLDSKRWHMSLNGLNNFCNPSAENIAKEMFLILEVLLTRPNLRIVNVRLYETPNCYTDCSALSMTEIERKNFSSARLDGLLDYKAKKGIVEYDDRKK